MFTPVDKPHNTYNGIKKYIVLTLLSSACLTLGLYWFIVGFTKPETTRDMEAISDVYIEHLMGHHEHLTDTHKIIDGLLVEGAKTMAHTKESIEDLVQSLKRHKFDFQGEAAPTLKKSMQSLKKNVAFGQLASSKIVEPENVTKAFRDTSTFGPHLTRVFPKEGKIVMELR